MLLRLMAADLDWISFLVPCRDIITHNNYQDFEINSSCIHKMNITVNEDIFRTSNIDSCGNYVYRYFLYSISGILIN